MPAVSMSDAAAHSREQYKLARSLVPQALGLEDSKHVKSIDGIACISLIALFILGCIGAAGPIPGPTLGWTTVGFGGVLLSARFLMGGDLSKRKWILCTVVLSSAVTITLGALGGMGILSAQQVGIGLATLIPIHTLVVSTLINRKVKPLMKKEYNLFNLPS